MFPWLLGILLPAVITLGNLEPPARLEAMGFAGVAAIGGAEALFGNPALVAETSGAAALLGYQGWYQVPELRTLEAGLAYGRLPVTLGWGVYRHSLGDFYAETQVLAVLAVSHGPLRVGLRPRWFQVWARDTAESWNASTVLWDLGVAYHRGHLYLGYHGENLTHRTLTLVHESQTLASRHLLAVSWFLPRNVLWSVAYVRWNGQSLYRIGVEAWFTPGFALRLGVDEKYLTLGMGLTDGQWFLDFAGRNVFPMGAVYALTTGYRW